MALGSFSGGYNENKSYVVVANQLGGVFRIDYLIVQQKMSAKAIKQVCSDVFASYMVVTSIDKKQLTDDNVYRILV